MSVVSPIVSSFGSTDTATSTFTSSDFAYDYALGGVGLLACTSGDTPYRRQTAEYRKAQQDTGTEPGEQSLVYWWMRSQQSFHGGQGRKFLEQSQADDVDAKIQFESSVGLDVWTPGEVTLLPQMTQLRSLANGSNQMMVVGSGSTAVVFVSDGSTLYRVDQAGASASVTWGGANTITGLATDGVYYYAADNVGIYRGTVAGGAGALVWNTGASARISWVKQRLMAAIGDSVYELVGAGPALPAAKYTSPQSVSWTRNFAETPSSILIGFSDDTRSGLLQFALDSGGVVPTLTSGTVVCTLPVGEVLNTIHPYLGRFLGLGTNKGVRVGVIDGENISYGPRSYEGSNVYAFTAEDNFLYFGDGNSISGQSGVWRLDLSRQLPDGRYPVASDLQAKVTGVARGLGLMNGKLVLAVASQGVYYQSATPESSGTLTTSRLRFSTLEPKLFKFLKVRTGSTDGTFDVDLIEPDGTETVLVSGWDAAADLGDLQMFLPPAEYIQLRFTFYPSGSSSPTFNGYQVKALPAQKRQRVETVPVLLFDFETDRNGNRKGRNGEAIRRLQELEDMEERGDILLFQHLTSDPEGNTSRLMVIDEIRFIQTTPPDRCNGWGGRCELVLRSVT